MIFFFFCKRPLFQEGFVKFRWINIEMVGLTYRDCKNLRNNKGLWISWRSCHYLFDNKDTNNKNTHNNIIVIMMTIIIIIIIIIINIINIICKQNLEITKTTTIAIEMINHYQPQRYTSLFRASLWGLHQTTFTFPCLSQHRKYRPQWHFA